MNKELHEIVPERKLGFTGLTALVFGMMVGSGIFNIPQNIAYSAGVSAAAVAWIITAFGILTLVFTFKFLSERRPDLNAGLYLYARQGFGIMPGYLTAWGYWLCTCFANVAYAVMLNDSFGSFFPQLLSHGWSTLFFASALIWGVFAIVCSGIKTAVLINTAMSMIKTGCVMLIVVLLIVYFNWGMMADNIAVDNVATVSDGGFISQIKNCMLVTLWCFIGIEGAVMMSGRARRPRDVARAGVAGFFSAWILYLLVSLLCFGIMSRAELSGLDNPSVAYVLKATCGEWAYWIVIISVILALGGSWIAWTIVCAEVPYTASRCGLFPIRFMKLSKLEIPTFGLLISSVIMQIFLIITLLSSQAYLTALDVTGMMILPVYMFTGMYLWKISTNHNPYHLATGLLCTIFCVFTIYSGGLTLFLETSLFYLLGLGFYFEVRREKKIHTYSKQEIFTILGLVIASAISIYLLFN